MVEAQRRIGILTVTITVAVMFLLLSRLAPILTASVSPWLTLPAAALTSIGTYTFLASIVSLLARRSRYLRRLLLGPADIEGTWVGYMVLAGEQHRVVEWIEQDIESVMIRGQCFKPDGSYYSQWNSNAVNLDIERGILTYTHTCEILDAATGASVYGLSKFQLERRSKSHSPSAMSGFSTDEGFQGRVQASQSRLSLRIMDLKDVLAGKKSIPAPNHYDAPAGQVVNDPAGRPSMR